VIDIFAGNKPMHDATRHATRRPLRGYHKSASQLAQTISR
jgi:hypothetical protein